MVSSNKSRKGKGGAKRPVGAVDIGKWASPTPAAAAAFFTAASPPAATPAPAQDGSSAACAVDIDDSDGEVAGVAGVGNKRKANLLNEERAPKRKKGGKPGAPAKRAMHGSNQAYPADRRRLEFWDRFHFGLQLIQHNNGTSTTHLWCPACRKPVSTSPVDVIKRHLKGKLHRDKVAALEKDRRRKERFMAMLNHDELRALREGEQLYRARVFEVGLGRGVSDANIVAIARAVEEHRPDTGGSIGDRSDLARVALGPLLKEKRLDIERLVTAGIPRRDEGGAGERPYIFLSFDGTFRVAEAFGIVTRVGQFQEWELRSILLDFQLLERSMDGPCIYDTLRDAVGDAGISKSEVIGWSRDRATNNDKASETMAGYFHSGNDIFCVAHFLDRSHEYVATPAVDEFWPLWSELLGSPKARHIFKAVAKFAPKTYSPTRFWSRFECIIQLKPVLLTKVPEYVAALKAEKCCEKTQKKLEAIVGNPRKFKQLQTDFVVVGMLEPVVQATYAVEGDVQSIFVAFDLINMARKCYQHQDRLNELDARLDSSFVGPGRSAEVQRICQHRFGEFAGFFNSVLDEGGKPASGPNRHALYEAFRAARVLDIFNKHHGDATVESLAPLKHFRALTALVEGVEESPMELAAFKAEVRQTLADPHGVVATLLRDKRTTWAAHARKSQLRWEWFGERRGMLPKLSKIFFLLCVMNANSCDVERVFSKFVGVQKTGAYENCGGGRVKLSMFAAVNGVDGEGKVLSQLPEACEGDESDGGEGEGDVEEL